jgi:hypothetical protein
MGGDVLMGVSNLEKCAEFVGMYGIGNRNKSQMVCLGV